MGWLDGSAVERKAGQLLLPVNDGTQNVITIPAFGGGKPNLDGVLYPDATYVSSASAGFGRNELVYACIRERAENLPQSVLRVYPGDQPAAHGESLENHRLRKLISQPNPVTGEFEFFELSVTYLDLAGNCYWLIQRGRDGLPAELWTVRPDMIHVKYANPLSAYFGQAPLRPAARAVSLDNAATDFVDTLLRNYAVPGVVIKTSSEVTQAVADKLKRKWKASFAGARRGEPAVLQAGMDVQPLGMSLRDLEFPDLRAFSESSICAALQVPPILVGAKVGLDRSTFTNYAEARKQLWEEAIFSLQRRFRDPVETQLLPEFSGTGRQRVTTRWDNSQVLALQEAESAKWERGVNALAHGGVTINDFRRLVGLEDDPAGNVFLLSRGVVPLPQGAVLQPGDEIGAQPPGDIPPVIPAGDAPGNPPAAPPLPQIRVASYADEFLADLARKRPDLSRVNGHGR